MPTLLEMNYLSRAWIMRKTLPWITFSTSVAFSLVISISPHFPPINNEMTSLEMQDRWLKWDIIFVETTQNRACLNQINMPVDFFFLFFFNLLNKKNQSNRVWGVTKVLGIEQ